MLNSSAQSALNHDSSLISSRWSPSACGKSCSVSTPGAPSCAFVKYQPWSMTAFTIIAKKTESPR